MVKKKPRLDTDTLFTDLLGSSQEAEASYQSVDAEREGETSAPQQQARMSAPVAPPITAQEKSRPKKAGRPSVAEERVQVSLYLTKAQNRELNVQGALKEKESDKSAIARTGIAIALSLTEESYNILKASAQAAETSMGEFAAEIIKQHFTEGRL